MVGNGLLEGCTLLRRGEVKRTTPSEFVEVGYQVVERRHRGGVFLAAALLPAPVSRQRLRRAPGPDRPRNGIVEFSCHRGLHWVRRLTDPWCGIGCTPAHSSGGPTFRDAATLRRPSWQGSGQVLPCGLHGTPDTKRHSLPAALRRKVPVPRSFGQCLGRRTSQSSPNSCMKRCVSAIGLLSIQTAVLLRSADFAPAPDTPAPAFGAEAPVVAAGRSGGGRCAGQVRRRRVAGHSAYERQSRISASMLCRSRRARNAVSMSTSTKRVSVWG